MNIPFPRALDEHLKDAGSIIPSKVSLNFSAQSVSTATIVLPFETNEIRMHSFFRLYNANGFCGIFRVTGENETIEKERQINLKHAIDTLNDSQYTAQEDFQGTPEAFFRKVLSHQKTVYWHLGVCEDETTYTRQSLNYDILANLVSEYITARSDYMFTYDFSAFPWTINIVKLPSEIGAEFRLRRNLTNNVRILRDDKSQCTRLNLSILSASSDAVEKKTFDDADAQKLYGIIERSAEIYKESVPDAEAWAKEYFSKNAHPAVSISAPAIELYAQTGEKWDEFSVGKLARVALPDYGEKHVERIISVSYPDVYAQPKAVTVQLANPVKSLSETMRDLRDLAFANASGVSSTKKELNYWEMIVTEIKLAQDKTGITDLWQSGIILDAKEGVKVFSLYEGMAALKSWIDINSEEIDLRVMKNGVISAINLTSEVARISAKKIVLDGYVTASELNAEISDIALSYAERVETDLLIGARCDLGDVWVERLHLGSNELFIKQLSMGEVESTSIMGVGVGPINLEHSHAVSVDGTGKVTLGEVSATGGNFNVADTTFYKDAVSAAYNRGYAAGTAASGGSYNDGYSTGYEAGWVAAAAMASSSRNGQRITVRRPSSIVDTPADDTIFTVSAGGGINSITNTAPNTFFAQGICEAYISVNNSEPVRVATVTKTHTQTIKVGQ